MSKTTFPDPDADAGTDQEDRQALPPQVRDHLKTGDPTGAIDTDGRIAQMSPELLECLGFAPGDDLSGLDFSSLWAHSDRPRLRAALALLPRGDTPPPPGGLHLDLSYLTREEHECELRLWRAGVHILFDLRCPGAAAG